MRSPRISRCWARLATIVALNVVVAATGACRQLGYTDRVLLTVPAPDGRMVAVCQEIPQLDGPGFEVRIERADGTGRRRLYQIGDGDPCNEMAWSSDGATLAVLSAHVARLRFVDIAWARKQPASPTASWSWRQVDLSTDRDVRLGKHLRFTGALEVELTTCSYSIVETQRTHARRCTTDERRQRFQIPTPIMTGRAGAARPRAIGSRIIA